MRHRWHRVAEYQRVALKLIAEGMLSSTPGISSHVLAAGLFFRRELTCRALRFARPVKLVVSRHNPGAEGLANELANAFDGITIEMKSVGTMQTSGRSSTSSLMESFTTLPSVYASFSRLPSVYPRTSPKVFFLLYLNNETFLGEDGEHLGEQVCAARRRQLDILLVHENVDQLGGCEFSRWHRICCLATLALMCTAALHPRVEAYSLCKSRSLWLLLAMALPPSMRIYASCHLPTRKL